MAVRTIIYFMLANSSLSRQAMTVLPQNATHHFGSRKLEPDPQQSEKQDPKPDPHQSKNFWSCGAQNGAMEGSTR
jgi:hypothetical protein